jgi:hypothetical protein
MISLLIFINTLLFIGNVYVLRKWQLERIRAQRIIKGFMDNPKRGRRY